MAHLNHSDLKAIPKTSNCDDSYAIHFNKVTPDPTLDEKIAPFIVAGYDIECVSGDENFPQASRKTDKIIQIGITLYRLGSLNCYRQIILTLKHCDPSRTSKSTVIQQKVNYFLDSLKK